MNNTQTKLTLHSALHQLQQLNAAIRLTPSSIAIWCPGRIVPQFIRQTIIEHKEVVMAMIRIGRIEVCPSPALHREEWDSGTCAICQRLAVIDQGLASRSNFDKLKV